MLFQSHWNKRPRTLGASFRPAPPPGRSATNSCSGQLFSSIQSRTPAWKMEPTCSPKRRMLRKLNANFLIAAKPGQCCLRVSAISFCWKARSVWTGVSSAGDTRVRSSLHNNLDHQRVRNPAANRSNRRRIVSRRRIRTGGSNRLRRRRVRTAATTCHTKSNRKQET